MSPFHHERADPPGPVPDVFPEYAEKPTRSGGGGRVSTAASGRAREYRVRDDMIKHGWHLVARSAGSKGAADLVMVHPEHGLALVQVGTSKKALGPAARVRFVRLAELCSALAVLATPTPGVGIRYRLAGLLGPMSWEEWSP